MDQPETIGMGKNPPPGNWCSISVECPSYPQVLKTIQYLLLQRKMRLSKRNREKMT
jgi:hypothetical protein